MMVAVGQSVKLSTAPERSTLLNQILAVRASVKGDVEKKLFAHHHRLRQPVLLSGMARTYVPRDDEDYRFPDEGQTVQVKARQVLDEIAADMADLFDVTAAMDWTNQHARADVVLLGGDQPVTLLTDVPVTYLLFLEKQLLGIEDLVRKLPVLPPTEQWELDPATDTYKTPRVGTTKTKKVMRNHVKAEATDRHPAQVDTYTEDVPIGTWYTVKFSGALPAEQVNKMLNRVHELQKAVKFAREQANMEDVVKVNPGRTVMDYLFAA